MMGMVEPMNASDMLDYSLGQLEGPAREQVERDLAGDPAAAEKVARLSRSIHRLLDEGETFDPPPGLAERTLSLVHEAARRKRTILDFVPVAVPFRPADVAVAAGIFVAGLLTLLPAVQKSRDRMEQAGCGYNLQQLGRALWQYGSQHQHYPFGPDKNPKAPAGAYVAMLNDCRLLPESDLTALLDCPCNGAQVKHPPLPPFDSLCELQRTDPKRCRAALCSDYAYNVGYQHPSGKVVAVDAVHMSRVPLLADQPPLEGLRTTLDGNSPNHGGRGQNVLYSDLHIGWHNTRRIGPKDDDMYLNARHEIGPGLSSDDVALLPSIAPALGW